MRLIFWCLSLMTLSVNAGQLKVEVHGKNAILMNADTGAILYEKNPHALAYPASTTKIATALYILDRKQPDLNQLVTVPDDAVKLKNNKNRDTAPHYWNEADGSNIGLLKGEVLSINALLQGLMLRSGNDAALTLAIASSGSVPNFMDEVNQYLKEIGCVNSCYYNPHGYHHPDQLTTAYDLCLMMRKALQNPTFREIIGKEIYVRPKTNKRAEEIVTQSNALMVKGQKHYYPKSIGGKTGYYSLAGCNLVTAAVHEGRTLIAVTMGAETRADTFSDVRNLFEAAFAEQPVSRLLVPANQTYGKDLPGAKKNLEAILVQDVTVSYYPAEEPRLRAFVQWDNLTLPIRKGQRVGEIRAFDERENLLSTSPLYAKEAVEKTFLFALQEKWDSFWNRSTN